MRGKIAVSKQGTKGVSTDSDLIPDVVKQSIIAVIILVTGLSVLGTQVTAPDIPEHADAAQVVEQLPTIEPTHTEALQQEQLPEVVNIPSELETPATEPLNESQPVITWQDNPNNCTDSQWIAEDAPFNCIDKPKPVAQKPTAAVQPTGNWVEQCHAWAAEAGVQLNASAIKLLERESRCNPTICNPNGIACGIPQALPWTKMGCDLSVADAPCQLKWFEKYVTSRYGSYEKALAHSYANNWY